MRNKIFENIILNKIKNILLEEERVGCDDKTLSVSKLMIKNGYEWGTNTEKDIKKMWVDANCMGTTPCKAGDPTTNTNLKTAFCNGSFPQSQVKPTEDGGYYEKINGDAVILTKIGKESIAEQLVFNKVTKVLLITKRILDNVDDLGTFKVSDDYLTRKKEFLCSHENLDSFDYTKTEGNLPLEELIKGVDGIQVKKICYKNESKDILDCQWAKYQADGATEGECVKKIEDYDDETTKTLERLNITLPTGIIKDKKYCKSLKDYYIGIINQLKYEKNYINILNAVYDSYKDDIVEIKNRLNACQKKFKIFKRSEFYKVENLGPELKKFQVVLENKNNYLLSLIKEHAIKENEKKQNNLMESKIIKNRFDFILNEKENRKKLRYLFEEKNILIEKGYDKDLVIENYNKSIKTLSQSHRRLIR